MKFRFKECNKWFYNEDNNETLGFFTGAKDCNGKDVYSGDIIKTTSEENDFYYIIVWNKENLAWCLNTGIPFKFIIESDIRFEVVGNKFDNTEYLNRILKYDGTKKD